MVRITDWRFPTHPQYLSLKASLAKQGHKIEATNDLSGTEYTTDSDFYDSLHYTLKPLQKHKLVVNLQAKKAEKVVKDFDVTWEFERDLFTADRRHIAIVAMFSGHALALNVPMENITFNLGTLTLPYDMEELLKFYNDTLWQNKVSHYWQALRTSKEITELASILYPQLPTQPYRPYSTFNDNIVLDYIKDWSDVVLSMSFGKESLLTFLLLDKFYGLDGAAISVFEQEANWQRASKSKLEALKEHTDSNFTVGSFKTDIMKQLGQHCHWGDAHCSYTYPAIWAATLINSNKKIIFFGDEYERSVEVPVIQVVDGQEIPTSLYTFDYIQSSVLHAKFNRLLSRIGLEERIATALLHLTEFQIQYLLWKIAPDLVEKQVSCWKTTTGEEWCNNCSKCKRIGFMLSAMGLPLPGNLVYIEEEEILPKNGRDLFACDLGVEDEAGLDTNGTGLLLDLACSVATDRIMGDYELSTSVPYLSQRMPLTNLHPETWSPKMVSYVNDLLKDHPLA